MSRSGRSGRIRLTYLITDLKVGGVPLHLYRLATRLPADRFSVRVISLADIGPVGTRLLEAGIPVQACGAASVRSMGALVRLWKWLVADPPDLLHSMLFHANVAARLLGPLAGLGIARILNEIQTVEVERPWHLRVDGWTCRLCRFEIGNSPSVITHLHGRAGIPLSRLRCEWGAVDVAGIAAATPLDRGTLGIRPSEIMVLWTGRLDPVKGFEEMLEAVSKLRGRFPLRVVLAGEGAYRSNVEALVRRWGLHDTVRLLGSRNDIPALLKTADLFMICSRTEGLPNSLLEAMAAGLPIMATDVPGCRDLVRHLDTGVLVRAGSAESIASGLETLLADSHQGRELGIRAQAWARTHVDTGTWVARWVGLYEALRS
jgi:glycosyltransferase involved in cell wall biosynthesis